jgi:hypothetical protein
MTDVSEAVYRVIRDTLTAYDMTSFPMVMAEAKVEVELQMDVKFLSRS